jgi:hypothetical protein
MGGSSGRGSVALALVVLVLSGCAAAPPPAPTAMEQGRACSEALRAQPDFAFVYERLPASAAGMPLARLNDPALPTPEEAAALGRWHEANIACRRHYLASAAQASSAHVAALGAQYGRADAIYAALAERRIAWGEAARQFAAARSQGDAAIAGAQQRLEQRQDAQDRAAEAEAREDRRAAAEALTARQRADRDAALMQELTRPRRTNCQQMGWQISCSTQ